MMQKHELSEQELTDLQIQDVIERGEVSTPVLAYKVSGSRVELHLLGGPIAYVEADWLVEPEQAIGRAADAAVEAAVEAAGELLDDLEEMTYEALYKLAQKLKVRGRSTMEEGELVAAIREKRLIS